MIVTDIAPQKRRPNRYSVFVDGDFVFGMSGEDIITSRLKIDMEITRERLDYLTEHVVFVRAQEKAMRYLGHQPRTAREVLNRLNEENFPAAVIDRVMAILLKYKYIDDEAFAAAFAESRMSRAHYGPHRIKQELRRKGVADGLIDKALEATRNEQDEVAVILIWLRKKRFTVAAMDFKQRKRCTDALLRRGFSYDMIKTAYSEQADPSGDYEEYI